MAPKKPSKPNGFFMFAQELKNAHGRKYKSMKDACFAANELWKGLSAQQKQHYNEMAKGGNSSQKPTRYTSDGVDVEVLTNQEKEEQLYLVNMKKEIFKSMDIAYNQGTFADELYFIIHINIHCFCQPENTYYPAEIGVSVFNLKDGIKPKDIFHYIVHPGPLPIGYKFEAKQHSDETHQLEVPFDSTDNTEEVYENLVQFLTRLSPGCKNLPVLYAEDKYIKVIHNILNSWSLEFSGNDNLFRVYNLPIMFQYMKNKAAGDDGGWATDSISKRELEKDVYADNRDYACDIHQYSSMPSFCSRSTVIRYAFVICDQVCRDLGIKLVPGRHVPLNADIPEPAICKQSNVRDLGPHYSRASKSSRQSERTKRDFTDEETADNLNSETWDAATVMSACSVNSQATSMKDSSSFPLLNPLGDMAGPSFPTFSDTSSVYSKNSKSYAGVSGLPRSSAGRGSLPPAFDRNFENLSISSHDQFPSIGRGTRRPGGSSVANGDNSDSDNSVSTARGRGFAALVKGRGVKKPGGN